MLIVNAGTASTLRLRGNTRPCYNVIEAEEGRVEVYRKYPFKERQLAVRFDRKTRDYSRSGRRSAPNIAVTRSIEPDFSRLLRMGMLNICG